MESTSSRIMTKKQKNNCDYQFNIRYFYDRLIYPTHFKRLLFFFFSDSMIIAFSLYISFFIRFEFTMPVTYRIMFLDILPFFLFIKLTVFSCFKIYKIQWRYVSSIDLLNIASAQLLSMLLLFMLIILIPFPSLSSYIPNFLPDGTVVKGFPRSVIFIDGIISIFLFCSLRISKKLFLEVNCKRNSIRTGKRTIIVGAGNTGEMILRDLRRQGFSEYYPMGLLDDDKNKVGTYIHGVKVLDTTNVLPAIISNNGIEAVFIAIPSLNYKTVRRIYSSAKNVKVDTIKIVPRIYNFHKPDLTIKNLEDIKIEDLLGRQMVDIDHVGIEAFLKDKVILITGAGGSIGSEITLQVCSFQPKKVILFDIDETELHNMRVKIEKTFPGLFDGQLADSRIQDKVVFITGDVRDEKVVTEVFEQFKPQIVFHAAAYKHVPMMEINASEAVKVNVFGTYRVVKASVEHHVEKFVLISTDKAVKPTSIMGATKRMAEYICTAFNESGSTSFISVRFGNVLGSRGSVLPLFLEQLKNGGPLTVTHKDMQRFFMTIPEAVSLVLQASILGNGGDVLVLDMGKPVRIIKLAEELIRIHGLQPYTDIDIKFVGLRPGEKLLEEILTEEEGTTATKHKKIFVAKNSDKYSKDEIEKMLNGFEKLLKILPITEDYEIIRDMIKNYVKSFERRRQEGIRQESEVITKTTLSQAYEINFLNFKLQFEKLLKMLPMIEDHEIIKDTVKNYIKSLARRRQERSLQKSEVQGQTVNSR